MVENLIIEWVGSNAIRLRWTTTLSASPPPVFYVYRDGLLVDTTTARERIETLLAGESPMFEVLDDPAALPRPGFPGNVVLAWYAPDGGVGIEHYLVQELVNAVWTTRKTIDQVVGQTYYLWSSRLLEDDTTHQFRVIPVGTNRNDGTAAELDVLMVRYPSPPVATFTFDPVTDAVTIAAGS